MFKGEYEVEKDEESKWRKCLFGPPISWSTDFIKEEEDEDSILEEGEQEQHEIKYCHSAAIFSISRSFQRKKYSKKIDKEPKGKFEWAVLEDGEEY